MEVQQHLPDPSSTGHHAQSCLQWAAICQKSLLLRATLYHAPTEGHEHEQHQQHSGANCCGEVAAASPLRPSCHEDFPAAIALTKGTQLRHTLQGRLHIATERTMLGSLLCLMANPSSCKPAPADCPQRLQGLNRFVIWQPQGPRYFTGCRTLHRVHSQINFPEEGVAIETARQLYKHTARTGSQGR